MKTAIETIADNAIKKEIETINRKVADALGTEAYLINRYLRELPDETQLAQCIEQRLFEVRDKAIADANDLLVDLLTKSGTPVAA